MTLVLTVGTHSVISKASVRRIEETNRVAAFKTTNHLLNYLASTVPFGSLNKHCAMMS